MITASQKEAQRKLRWHETAKRVLGACSCIDAYKLRDLIAPDCVWHHCKDELIEAMAAEYLQGKADQRYEWMSRIAGRHGDG